MLRYYCSKLELMHDYITLHSAPLVLYCYTVVPQLWLLGRWQLTEVTVLDPSWVLQVRHTGYSRTVHVSLLGGEPVREVERRGRLCPLWPRCSVCTLIGGDRQREQ